MFRRTHGGRRLWESKDDRKWGHDKFEELTSQERHYEEVMILDTCNPHDDILTIPPPHPLSRTLSDLPF